MVAAMTLDMKDAEVRLVEEMRVKTTLLRSQEWRRQVSASHEFFTAGNRGYRLSELAQR